MGTDQGQQRGAFGAEGHAGKEANPRGWGLGRREPGLGAGKGRAPTEKLKCLFLFQEQREEEELVGRI